MRGFVRFWHRYSLTLVRSVSDLRFYREVRAKRPKHVIGHLAVLLILFWVIPFAIVFFGGVRQVLDATIAGLREHVPPGTEFRMEDGRLTSTLEAPIVVREDGFAFIVNTASSTEALGEDEIGIVVNADEVVQKEAPNRTQTVDYSDAPDFSVTREDIGDGIARYAVWVVLLLALVAVPLFFVGVSVAYAGYLMFHAFLFWLAMRLFRAPMRYAEAFVVVGFAATMPIALKAVFTWGGVEIFSAATWLYWLLLGLIVYDLVKGSPRKEVSEHGKQEAKGNVPGPRPGA